MVKPRARHHSAPTRPSHQRPRSQRKGKKPAKIFNNALVAQNWDREQTLSQNYARLGLTARLGKAKGGVEHTVRRREAAKDKDAETEAVGVGEVEVLRDEEGRIVGIVQPEGDEMEQEDDGTIEDGGVRRRKTAAELRCTPLNPVGAEDLSTHKDGQEEEQFNPHAPTGHLGSEALATAAATGNEEHEALVGQLTRQALYAQKQHAGRARRKQSQREREWCAALLARHGRDYVAMARDTKLNIMQQSEGDIKRRVQKYIGKRTSLDQETTNR